MRLVVGPLCWPSLFVRFVGSVALVLSRRCAFTANHGLRSVFVSGFTIVRNGIKLGYPFEASIRSLLPLVDELVVAVGEGDDDTWDAVANIGDPKIQAFSTRWDLSAHAGRVLSQQTNLALARCRGPWAVYLQADEVLHEDSLSPLRRALNHHLHRDTEGLLFDYSHFHGSYDWMGADWRSWYPFAFRALKVGIGIESVGDAAGFRIRRDGRLRGLIGAASGARIFHYGWCRPPAQMEEKQANLERLLHGSDETRLASKASASLPIFDQRRGHLIRFAGTHPQVMAQTIAAATWTYEPRRATPPPGIPAIVGALFGSSRRRVIRFFLPQPLKNACWRILDLWRSLRPSEHRATPPRSESSTIRRRVLILQPSLQPPGGGNAVAAWVVQALRDDCEISLFCRKPVDCEAINRFFGTSLSPDDFEVHLFESTLMRAIDAIPIPLTLLRMCLLFRGCRAHLKSRHYDVVISTMNETDLGEPGIQYVHFPWDYEPRPDADLRWYHGIHLFLWAYRRLCRAISGIRLQGIRDNLTLTNSDYIGEKMRFRYGIEAETLHPPVPGEFPIFEWEERANGFVCVGRISPEKELEKVISIVHALRERGHDVQLHIVGTEDNPAYYRKIVEKLAPYQAWARLHENLSRNDLVALLTRNRFGLHGMVGEHFGIAVAELVKAGCVTFVPDQGGPVEIVGGQPGLLYGSRSDAIDKIERVLSDIGLQKALHATMLERLHLFTAERFVERWREIVRNYPPSST